MPVTLVFIQSNSFNFCRATWLPRRVKENETLLPVLLHEPFQFFRRVANLQTEPECHSQKLSPLPLPPASGYSGSVLRLNSVITTAKGKHVSFHSAGRGKVRSREGSEMKGITTGGTHPPGDEQTIPRTDGKYFQHCGRAGQASLFPHVVCSYNMVITGILKKHKIQLGEGFKLSMASASPE